MSKKIKIFQNRKARFNYETIQKLEVGIVLFGNEIRSIRDGKVVLDNSYAVFKKGEIWVLNLYVDLKGYKKGFETSDNVRPKKLLLKKKTSLAKVFLKACSVIAETAIAASCCPISLFVPVTTISSISKRLL